MKSFRTRCWNMRKSEHIDVQTDYLEQLGYETRDIELAKIARWIALLFVFIGITSAATWAMYWGFLYLARSPRSDSGPAIARRLPKDPNPTVQPYPLRGIRRFREEEEEKNKVDWKDRNANTFSIPVERAIDLTLERHTLPARGQASTQNPAQ